jgi:hypothetical protein
MLHPLPRIDAFGTISLPWTIPWVYAMLLRVSGWVEGGGLGPTSDESPEGGAGGAELGMATFDDETSERPSLVPIFTVRETVTPPLALLPYK